MPSSANYAYDLSRYEIREQQVPEPPQLRVVKSRKREQPLTRPAAIARFICVGLILVALIAANICNRVALTDVSAQIETYNSQLRELQGDAVRLSSQLENRTSLRTLEETASARLGLGKMERSQITYVNMSEGDKIVYSEAAQGNSSVQETYEKVLKLLKLK